MIDKFIRLAAILLAAAISAAPARSQEITSDVDFSGVKSLHVTVSPLTVDSIDCNIDGDYLIRELTQQMESEGLSASNEHDTLAVITVLSARQTAGGACNSAVMLGAYKKTSFFDENARWIRTGYLVLWQSGLLVSSAADAHLAATRDALAHLGDAMVSEWKKANTSTPSVSTAPVH